MLYNIEISPKSDRQRLVMVVVKPSVKVHIGLAELYYILLYILSYNLGRSET